MLSTFKTHDNLRQLLNTIEYKKYGWDLCGDLKVVALLMGLQQGYTKYMCFLCEWDSQARELNYTCGKNELECPAPQLSGRGGWENPATTPSHQTRFEEELCESNGPDFAAAFRYLHEKSP